MPSGDIIGESVKEDENPVTGQSGSQKGDSEPKSGVSPAEVPYPQAPDDEAAKDADGSYDWWRNAFAALALLISLLALGISIASWRTAEKTFYTTHRAAVYLGLPEGKIGNFIEGRERQVTLYFRNYGPTAARDVTIETYPVVNLPAKSTSPREPWATVDIPPLEYLDQGLSIPPGFTHVVHVQYSDATREELETSRKYLRIIGRISYNDSFEWVCEPFSVIYRAIPQPVFALTPPVVDANLCDRKRDILQNLTIVREGKGVEILLVPWGAIDAEF